MSKNSQIKIEGDGNAVGNGNKITIIKKTKIINQSSNDNDNSGKKKKSDDGEWVLPVAIGGALALVAFAYWFAKYADVIYALELSASFTTASIGGLMAAYCYWNDDQENTFRSGALMVLGLMLAFATNVASSTYNNAWIDLAHQSQTFKIFWCNLTFVQQQDALQHATQAVVLLAPSSILLVIHLSFACLHVSGTDDLPDWILDMGNTIAGSKSLAITFILCLLSLAAHSDAGYKAWQSLFNDEHNISFFCPGKTR